MIKIKRKIIFLILILTLAGGAVFRTTKVHAQSADANKFTTLVQMITDRFNLNKNDVKQVFDQYISKRQMVRLDKFEQKLGQAVKEEKITEDQKRAIIAKYKELQEKRKEEFGNWKNMTPEERRRAKQTQKQELENWAKQKGIDLKYFFGGHMGPKGGMKSGMLWK